MKRIDTNKSKEDLTKMLQEGRSRLTKLQFELNENKLKDVSQIKKAKKDIARILTALKLKVSKS